MSLGLALYLLGSGRRRQRAGFAVAEAEREPGSLIWFHAPDSAAAQACDGLWDAMRKPAVPLRRLVTGAETPLPPDTPLAATQFFDHWQPTLVILASPVLPAAFVTEAHRRDIPIFLVDTGGTPSVAGGGWYPGLVRALLQRITRILAQDEARAALFRRKGARAATVAVTGRVEQSATPLPCTEAEREAIAQGLHARLVWLAVSVPPEEEASILEAHAAALRLSHRLLLVLVPSDPAQGAAVAAAAEARGLTTALRTREEYPGDEDQVYVADTEGELGMWYRLAQICFLGGSFSGTGPLRHPLEPAALGSAIVHGPRTEPHQEILARLDAAQAARMVPDADALCDTIGTLRAPDRVAMMAHNAWVVASSGADVTERVADLIVAALAQREFG